MIQELLYTSAPRGLKPGSRGFCTVMSSRGLSGPLATALESLSGYRQIFTPDDPNASLNPVAWMHLTAALGGKTYSILSRVSDYGLDYSQRTNKLAHHMLLESSDLVQAGPAWVLSRPGFMIQGWAGEPRLLSEIRRIPSGEQAAVPCRKWGEMTGDPAWAGLLAECAMSDPVRPAILLFKPGQDLLPLMQEALSLLPPERRWKATFCTYYTNLPQTVNCAWRCIPADSPEAHQSRRLVNALRIDLTKPLGPAPENRFANQARTGQKPAASKRPDVLSGTGRAGTKPQPFGANGPLADLPDFEDLPPGLETTLPPQSHPSISTGPSEYSIRPPMIPENDEFYDSESSEEQEESGEFRNAHRSTVRIVLIPLAIVLLFSVIATGAYFIFPTALQAFKQIGNNVAQPEGPERRKEQPENGLATSVMKNEEKSAIQEQVVQTNPYDSKDIAVKNDNLAISSSISPTDQVNNSSSESNDTEQNTAEANPEYATTESQKTETSSSPSKEKGNIDSPEKKSKAMDMAGAGKDDLQKSPPSRNSNESAGEVANGNNSPDSDMGDGEKTETNHSQTVSAHEGIEQQIQKVDQDDLSFIIPDNSSPVANVFKFVSGDKKLLDFTGIHQGVSLDIFLSHSSEGWRLEKDSSSSGKEWPSWTIYYPLSNNTELPFARVKRKENTSHYSIMIIQLPGTIADREKLGREWLKEKERFFGSILRFSLPEKEDVCGVVAKTHREAPSPESSHFKKETNSDSSVTTEINLSGLLADSQNMSKELVVEIRDVQFSIERFKFDTTDRVQVSLGKPSAIMLTEILPTNADSSRKPRHIEMEFELNGLESGCTLHVTCKDASGGNKQFHEVKSDSLLFLRGSVDVLEKLNSISPSKSNLLMERIRVKFRHPESEKNESPF